MRLGDVTRKVLLGLFAVALATLTLWGAVTVLDTRRPWRVITLSARVDRAPAGDIIDFRGNR